MTAKFWDKQAEKYDGLVQNHDADYLRTIAGTKGLLSVADVVLDLGCASGEYSLDIAPYVLRLHGIDTSANMIALATGKASDRSIDNATFGATDIFDRSLDAHRFTAVLAFSLMHLVGEIGPVLDRINGLLPKGGLFVSQTPCLSESSFLFRLFILVARRLKIVPSVLSFTALELETAIAGAGFDIIESEEWDRKKAVHWIVARKR